ncbi:MAG: hypothetical protein NTZ83_01470 [Candidatus Pacearchaeota archaeon]|nr:hypothetical protein [Candidatus Pacearchaeota archaeon]
MAKKESKESDLEKLKENYKKIQKVHNLPDFDKLNLDFSIEKVAEVETDFLIREVARIMAEKFSNYLRFVELILNPVNSPMFIFSLIKTIGESEKKKLSEIYKELAKIELNLIELDVDFSEKKEAEFINSSYKTWMSVKKDFLEVIEKIKSNWDSKQENNNKAYFG